MKLKSIYEHMENATKKIPENANCKIIFRHSIRGKIDSGVGRKVKLTDEGVELARFFGRNLETEIGFVASSSCDRNIQTCEEILLGAKCKREIIIAPNELEGPQTKDKGLSDKVFEQYKNNKDIRLSIIYKIFFLLVILDDHKSKKKVKKIFSWLLMPLKLFLTNEITTIKNQKSIYILNLLWNIVFLISTVFLFVLEKFEIGIMIYLIG